MFINIDYFDYWRKHFKIHLVNNRKSYMKHSLYKLMLILATYNRLCTELKFSFITLFYEDMHLHKLFKWANVTAILMYIKYILVKLYFISLYDEFDAEVVTRLFYYL